MSSAAVMSRPDARERILAAAFELFDEQGLLDASIEDILARAKAAKATFYHCFGSKEAVVEAYLDHGMKNLGMLVEAAKAEGGLDGAGTFLAVFDFFDEWSQRSVVALSSVLRILNELEPSHPLRVAVTAFLDRSREHVAAAAQAAGLERPLEFARSFQILARGALVTTVEGDGGAARRARAMAEQLIALHRPRRPDSAPTLGP
ncbi:TetR/AcrR family transcriptional regulator [Sinomonas albida]|uniref:TetR/AcrR family transcriptional regulator n=1 Tax=Sinomonas albida TaxID=369942 RepID=UPI0010A8100A|nr:TetR/AcrR family transcriptional regulator [Sinomonas albida]